MEPGRGVPGWVLAIGALSAALLALPAAGQDAPPPRLVPWQEPSPFARPFLQLPFDDPVPLRAGRTEIGLRTLYSNSLMRGRSRALSVDVSLEEAAPALFVRRGFEPGLELQLAVPGVVDYAGFLWRPIKAVESVFASVNVLRTGPPPGEARFRVVRPDGRGVDWTGTEGGPGDVWAAVKAPIAGGRGGTALSWRAAVKVPTADVPFGSGGVELGAGLLGAWDLGDTRLRVTGDLMVPLRGTYTSARISTRPHAALQLGAAHRFTSWLSAQLQGSVHTSALRGTGLDQIDGSTWYVLAGVSATPSRRTSLTFALVENVFQPSRGADITAVLEMAWRR